MRVHIYKMGPEEVDIMAVSSPGKGRSPVVIQSVLPADVAEKVGPLVDQLRRPKGSLVVLPE